MDALRPTLDAERPGMHSHAERGNDRSAMVAFKGPAATT